MSPIGLPAVSSILVSWVRIMLERLSPTFLGVGNHSEPGGTVILVKETCARWYVVLVVDEKRKILCFNRNGLFSFKESFNRFHNDSLYHSLVIGEV